MERKVIEMEFATLNNGIRMPMEGFGVFQVPDPKVCGQAVLDAIASGYRLIDTAAAYHEIFTHPVLTKIGEKYGKSAAQVALRWNVERGVAVIPKSVHKERMEQNMDIWDFKLSLEDKREIAALDIGHSEIVNHYDPAFVKMLHGMKIHG